MTEKQRERERERERDDSGTDSLRQCKAIIVYGSRVVSEWPFSQPNEISRWPGQGPAARVRLLSMTCLRCCCIISQRSCDSEAAALTALSNCRWGRCQYELVPDRRHDEVSRRLLDAAAASVNLRHHRSPSTDIGRVAPPGARYHGNHLLMLALCPSIDERLHDVCVRNTVCFQRLRSMRNGIMMWYGEGRNGGDAVYSGLFTINCRKPIPSLLSLSLC